jgi:hypothetical protein
MSAAPPILGAIVNGRAVGLKSANKVAWTACAQCGKVRWVALRGGQPESMFCAICRNLVWRGKRNYASGPTHPHWRGGRRVRDGYVIVWLPADHLFSSMCKRGYVFEHRLILAMRLGRPLRTDEIAHHRNGDRSDNRPENLELKTRSEHSAGHRDARLFIARIQELEVENAELRARLAEIAQGSAR